MKNSVGNKLIPNGWICYPHYSYRAKLLRRPGYSLANLYSHVFKEARCKIYIYTDVINTNGIYAP